MPVLFRARPPSPGRGHGAQARQAGVFGTGGPGLGGAAPARPQGAPCSGYARQGGGRERLIFQDQLAISFVYVDDII